MDCEKKSSADVVFFNATQEELINKWLRPFHHNPIDKMPGVADNRVGQPEIRTFRDGLSIQYTADPNMLKFNLDCKPLLELCP